MEHGIRRCQRLPEVTYPAWPDAALALVTSNRVPVWKSRKWPEMAGLAQGRPEPRTHRWPVQGSPQPDARGLFSGL